MDESSKGTVMQENCWGLLTLRTALHSGNAMAAAAGGQSGAQRMCSWADLLYSLPSPAAVKKWGPGL